MRIAARDTDGTIWGLGETEAEALQDAYTWINDAAEWEYPTYEEFAESKQYDDLQLFWISEAAAKVVEHRGGVWGDLSRFLEVHHDRIITLEESEGESEIV